MPLNYDDLATTTFNNYRKSFSDNVTEEIILVKMLKKFGGIERKSGGIKIVEPLMYGLNNTFKSYSGYDLLDVTPQQGLTKAEYDWKNVAVSVTISDEELDQNKGEAKFLDLLKSKIKQAEMTHKMKFNEMLYGDGTGNAGKDFAGLASYVTGVDTGTIGGIDSANYAWWRNNHDTIPNFATDGLGKMRTMFNNCTVDGDAPNFILCDQTTYEQYEAMMPPLERIAFKEGGMSGDLGFEHLRFKGKPLAWDSQAPAKTMRFLNLKYLKLIFDSNKEFTMTDWRRPYNQMAKSCFIIARGNMVINNRKRQGYLSITAYE